MGSHPLKPFQRSLERLFHSDQAHPGRLRGWLQRGGQVLYLVGRKASRDLVFERAASLSFTTTVSFVPLSLLVFSLFASLGPNGLLSGAAVGFQRAVEDFKTRVVQYVAEDSRGEVREFLGQLESQVQRQAASVQWLALLVLLLTVVSLLRSAERNFCAVWNVPVKRGYLRKLGTFWLLLTLAPLILATSVYVRGSLERSLGVGGDPVTEVSRGPDLPETPPTAEGMSPVSVAARGLLLHWVFPISISFFAFTLLLTYLPNTRVRLDAAAIGGTVAALGWEVGTQGVATYLDHAFLSGVYGALGVVPFFLLWVYFSWLVALFGAELSYCVQNFPVLVQEVRYRIVGQRVAPAALALLFMEQVYSVFARAGQPLDASDLANRFRVAISEAEEVARALCEADLLVEDPDSRLSPRRAASLVTPGEVVRCFPNGIGLGLPDCGSASPLESLVNRVRQGAATALDAVTFADLAPLPPVAST
ncbi:MAG: YihY/virulence factor BrkB family protein [Planctomycetota bacterium]